MFSGDFQTTFDGFGVDEARIICVRVWEGKREGQKKRWCVCVVYELIIFIHIFNC